MKKIPTDAEIKQLDMLLTATFVSAQSTRLMLEDIDRRLIDLEDSFKHDAKMAFTAIRNNLRQSKNQFDSHIQPYLSRTFTDKETGAYNVEENDNSMRDANELCRLMLLYWDKCFQNFDNVNAVFKFLRSLPGMNVFTDADIEHYRLR